MPLWIAISFRTELGSGHSGSSIGLKSSEGDGRGVTAAADSKGAVDGKYLSVTAHVTVQGVGGGGGGLQKS